MEVVRCVLFCGHWVPHIHCEVHRHTSGMYCSETDFSIEVVQSNPSMLKVLEKVIQPCLNFKVYIFNIKWDKLVTIMHVTKGIFNICNRMEKIPTNGNKNIYVWEEISQYIWTEE